MKAFERFSKFFGMVRVKEIRNQVRITGIDGVIMDRYLRTIFETNVINKMMFTQITDTSITLHSFFIPDFLYMLTVFRMNDKCSWSGRRTIDRIVSGIMKDTWYKVTTQPYVPIVDEERKKLLKWNAMPKQLEALHLFGNLMPKYDLRGYILAMAPGTGKCQDLNSLVLTDTGWIRMGDITLDTKVVCPDGSLASVVGIYPQGKKDIYQITLEDGRVARSCDEHLWKVFGNETGDKYQILMLGTIKILQESLFHKTDLYIPVALPDNHPNIARRRIVSIEYVGCEEAQCIAINHPDHLYVTNDYIVTHNTFTDLLIATCIVPLEIAEVKIIISPKKAVHLVWEKSINAVFKKIPTHWVVGSGLKMPWNKCEYYVFNFEQLEQAIALGEHLITQNRRYIVIVDESHNFADHSSARTQKLVKLQTLRKDIYFIWASGSPILKSAAELSSFLKCSDPRFDSEAERRFKRIYSAAPGRANEIFNHRLGQMMAFIVGKSEVSTTKPTIKELPVKLPPSIANKFLMTTVREEMKQFIAERLVFYAEHIKDYRKVVEKWLHYHENTLKDRSARADYAAYQKNLTIIMKAPDLMLSEVMAAARNYERSKLLPSLPPTERKEFRNALSAVKNIKLKVRGEALGTVLSKRRSECAAALAIYCKPDQIMKESLSKTLFFASSVLPVKVLEKYLQNKGFEPMLVYAGTNSNLTANIEAFTNDPNINPICATMQSLSEAVPVIAASTVVLLNRPFRQATFDQIIARADRLGQIHPVTVVEVTLDTDGEPNVSSTTDAILASIRELINEIVGPEFAGPPLDERVYQEAIDASKEDPTSFEQDTKLGLL